MQLLIYSNMMYLCEMFVMTNNKRIWTSNDESSFHFCILVFNVTCWRKPHTCLKWTSNCKNLIWASHLLAQNICWFWVTCISSSLACRKVFLLLENFQSIRETLAQWRRRLVQKLSELVKDFHMEVTSLPKHLSLVEGRA